MAHVARALVVNACVTALTILAIYRVLTAEIGVGLVLLAALAGVEWS